MEKSGVTDHLVGSDKEALEKIRDIFNIFKTFRQRES